nr:hypothetical protein BC354_20185 [Vibrio cholerae]RGP94766.1 hypothetical protein BC352_19655 [Vibrio cholerae]
MVTGCPSEIRKSLYGSGGACWKTHYRQKLTVGTWAVMAVIYYIAMISHQGLIRIFPRVAGVAKRGSPIQLSSPSIEVPEGVNTTEHDKVLFLKAYPPHEPTGRYC